MGSDPIKHDCWDGPTEQEGTRLISRGSKMDHAGTLERRDQCLWAGRIVVSDRDVGTEGGTAEAHGLAAEGNWACPEERVNSRLMTA